MSASSAVTAGEPGPEPKRRKLLDAGGPIEDDETARQKMRDAKVYARGVDRTEGQYDGFDPDNVADVKRFSWQNRSSNASAVKPMGYFAERGDLPMMRWLYVNGADTRDVDVGICFPMWTAANHGHLEVCKWLLNHGAAKDIKRRARRNNVPPGPSPLTVAFGKFSYRNLSRWLIMNGALCKHDDSGKLDVEIMRQDLNPVWLIGHVGERKALLEWANDLHGARTTFLLFLSGALSRPKHARRTRRNVSAARLLAGNPGILELIGDYVGFVRGREARIVRQLTEMLPNLILQQLDDD